MKFQAGRRNLICVLDWGIGHASRSLALARRLVDHGETVNFASAGGALAMLRHEWDEPARFFPLVAYNIDYRSSKMAINVGRQLPKIINTVRKEHRQLANILQAAPHDRVISDSRFGCFHSRIPSVMLTHQLHPIFGLPLAGNLYRWFLQRNFSEFWVPDHQPPGNLSGQLSDPCGYSVVNYVGPLSRLKVAPPPIKKIYDYGCLLSGPEPQRTYLEELLLKKLKTVPGKHWVVAGQPGKRGWDTVMDSPASRIDSIAFSSAEKTALLLRQSRKIICRSGYSTLMDLDHLRIENILLIPTPGQTEQIYLAQRWADLGRANWVPQKQLDKMVL